MSVRTYFGTEDVKVLYAELVNYANTHGIKFSGGCQLNPAKKGAEQSLATILNWMTCALIADHGMDEEFAKQKAKDMFVEVFKAQSKLKLYAEWRQISWWALRVIDVHKGKTFLTPEVHDDKHPDVESWEEWMARHGFVVKKKEPKPGPVPVPVPTPRPLPQKATLRPQYPPGCEDENTLLGFLYRALDHGMSKVRMQEDDGKVVSILLSGPAGVGKTWSVQHIGETYFNAKVFVITAGQRVTDYLGYSDANGVYHASSLILALEYALENPGQLVIIMLDELDMTPPDTSGVLFSVLASRRLETLHTGFKMFPKNCTFVAAMNTIGNGADEDFVGRTPVDKAMLDRFVFPFNAYFEEATARKLCNDGALVDLALDWNQACHESNLTKMVLSYRHLNAAQMALDAGFSLNYALGKITMAQSRNDLDTVFSNLKHPKSEYAKVIEKCIQAVPVR